MPLTITPTDLDALRGTTKTEAGDACYAAVRAAVVRYGAATAVPDQLTLLAEIGRLAADWVNAHRGDASPSTRIRRALLDRLQEETVTESKRLSDRRAHEIYVGNVRAGSAAGDRTARPAEEPDPEGRYRFGALKTKRDVTVSDKGRALADEGKLTEAERTAIVIYTGGDYAYVNPATANDLRWLEANTSALTPAARDMPRAAVLQEGTTHAAVALAGLRKLNEHKGEVYRGARLTPERFATLRTEFAVGTQVPLRTLTSTSARKIVALRFAHTQTGEAPIPAAATIAVLFVYAAAGGRDVRAFSQSPREDEVLLLPGTSLQVESFDPYDPAREPGVRLGQADDAPKEWFKVTLRGPAAA